MLTEKLTNFELTVDKFDTGVNSMVTAITILCSDSQMVFSYTCADDSLT